METGLFAVIALGLVSGIRHAVEPDHVIAVSTLLHRTPTLTRAARTGLAWGAGHTTMLMAGVLLVSAMRIQVPEEHLQYFELPVAVLLLVLGAWTLFQSLRHAGLLRRHRHEGIQHYHVGDAPHPHDFADRRAGWGGFLVGSIHGLAGSGALLLIAAAALPSLRMALAYALVFGGGSMVGMAAVSCGLAIPLIAARSRPAAYNLITAVSGGSGVMLGGLILYGAL